MAGKLAGYARPAGPPTQLAVKPELASWEVAGHPSQTRLTAFLDAAEEQLGPMLRPIEGPQAFRLDVGLPAGTPLLAHRDLDNYLLPLISRLRPQHRFVSVWVTKAIGEKSFVRVEAARPVAGDFLEVRTTASSQRHAYKEQIKQQSSGAALLPDGPVLLELSFCVGPGRNWLSLWKPTIDALGTILGVPHEAGPWHPDDGRITELGLHCAVDAGLGHDVVIGIRAGR